MAGYAVFHAGADLTKRSEMVIVNWINCEEFALVRNITATEGEVLVEKLEFCRTAINEAKTASDIWREAAQRIAAR